MKEIHKNNSPIRRKARKILRIKLKGPYYTNICFKEDGI